MLIVWYEEATSRHTVTAANFFGQLAFLSVPIRGIIPTYKGTFFLNFLSILGQRRAVWAREDEFRMETSEYAR